MKSFTIFCTIMFICFTNIVFTQGELRVGVGVQFEFESFKPDVTSKEGKYKSDYGCFNCTNNKFAPNLITSLNLGYFLKMKEKFILGASIDFSINPVSLAIYSNYTGTFTTNTAISTYISDVVYFIKKSTTNIGFIAEKYLFPKDIFFISIAMGMSNIKSEIKLNIKHSSLIDLNNIINEELQFNKSDYNFIYQFKVGLKLKKDFIYFIPSIYAGSLILPNYYGSEYYKIKSAHPFILGTNIQLAINI